VQTITNVGYHRCDPGLYLQVAKGGTKSWLFRFKSPVTSKQREMGLGSLSIISLAQARNLALEYRQQLLEGVDPLEEKRAKKQVKQLQQNTCKHFLHVSKTESFRSILAHDLGQKAGTNRPIKQKD
jgi:hypothetical protein